MEGSSRRVAVIIMGILTLILAIVAVIIGLRLQEGALPDNSSASTVITTVATTTRSTTTTTTSSSGCPNTAITVWCTTWNCPNGDTNGDGQCTSQDSGSSYSVGSGTGCGTPSSGCGQRDYYNAGPAGQNWGAYYCNDFLNFSGCGGSNTTTSRSTTTTANTTTSNTTTARTTTSNTTTSNTTTTTSSPVCGNGVAETGEQCGEPGRSCPAGYTCNNCLCFHVSSSCGNGLAEAGEECGEPGLSCPTGSTCNNCLCQANAQCGQACGVGGTCPTGHTCSAGICKLDYCLQNAGNCSDGACNPISCGEQCAPGGLCPTGHTCQSNICVANQCLNGGCSDKCNLDNIPRTALISDDVDRALLAGIVIVLGYLMLRFKLIDNLWLETKQVLNLPGNTDKVEIAKEKKPKKKPGYFEDRFD